MNDEGEGTEGRLPPNFSWVTERLSGSGHPGFEASELERSIAALRAAGIGCIVSLAHLPSAPVAAAGLVHIPLAVPDMGVPELGALADAIEGVTRQLATGAKVLVHCGAGYGRTGLFLACLLVTQGMSAAEAVAHVRRGRPGSIETEGQEAFIARWEGWYYRESRRR